MSIPIEYERILAYKSCKIQVMRSGKVNKLVLSEELVEEGVDEVGLVGVHGPPGREFELPGLEFLPAGTLDHELPGNPGPPLLPVDPRIEDQHCHLVDAGVVSHQPEPTARHRPELVLVLDETVIVELVLVDGALVVGSDRVSGAQFLERDHAMPHALHLHLPLQVPLEGGEEETVRRLVDLGDLDVLRLLDGLPVFRVLYEETFRDVADAVRLRFRPGSHETVLAPLVVEEPERFLGVVGEGEASALLSDEALILAEDDGGRAEESALLRQLVDLLRSSQPRLVEGEVPVLQHALRGLHLKYFKNARTRSILASIAKHSAELGILPCLHISHRKYGQIHIFRVSQGAWVMW